MWTDQDRALMQARQMHRSSLCPGCGQPRERAWHPAMEGWYEVAVLTCWACAAHAKTKAEPHQHVALHDSYDDTGGPLGPIPAVTYTDPEDLAVQPMNHTPYDDPE